MKTFLTPLQTESTFFAPSLIKVETFLTPLVWIEKLTAMKQVCVAGRVR
jgi:hypothetical protein